MFGRDLMMKFHYSTNSEVQKHVNQKTGKIAAGGNFRAFNEHWIADTNEIKHIANEVIKGHGLCAWHLIEGKRTRNETGCIRAG